MKIYLVKVEYDWGDHCTNGHTVCGSLSEDKAKELAKKCNDEWAAYCVWASELSKAIKDRATLIDVLKKEGRRFFTVDNAYGIHPDEYRVYSFDDSVEG
mgnify:CR=1 FL=1